MTKNSKIEWTDRSDWNPIRGCTRVSEGCRNCYAESIAARFSGPGQAFEGFAARTTNGPRWTGKVELIEERLSLPLRWRKPARIFVNSAFDLFHEDIPDKWIDRVFAVMALAPQHTFQLLTKRAARMRDYLGTRAGDWMIKWPNAFEPGTFRMPQHELIARLGETSPEHRNLYHAVLPTFPLPNVWIGVSVEDQQSANERIPDLLSTPAAVRWVSAEPLLGAVNLRRVRIAPEHHTIIDALDGYAITDASSWSGSAHERTALNWVVVGGESGPGARPMHPAWARSIRDQCQAAGVPFFFKQWGEFTIVYDRECEDPDWQRCGDIKHAYPKGRWINLAGGQGFHGDRVVYVDAIGKKQAGRLLDGVEHNAMPERVR